MNILLWTDDLMSKVRVESRWKQAGAEILKRYAEETADLVVVDLGARGALDQIKRLHELRPDRTVIAYGPHVDGEAFKSARALGADEVVARGSVVDRVLRHINSG